MKKNKNNKRGDYIPDSRIWLLSHYLDSETIYKIVSEKKDIDKYLKKLGIYSEVQNGNKQI
jgi:hypothetical protein